MLSEVEIVEENSNEFEEANKWEMKAFLEDSPQIFKYMSVSLKVLIKNLREGDE